MSVIPTKATALTDEQAAAVAVLAGSTDSELEALGLSKRDINRLNRLVPGRSRHGSPFLPNVLSDLKVAQGCLLLVVTDGSGTWQAACVGGKGDEVTLQRWDEVMHRLRGTAEAHIAAGARCARIYHVRDNHSARVTLLLAEYERRAQ